MNNEVLMRVGNSRTDLAEQAEPRVDAQVMFRRVGLEGNAFHVFHHKVREALLRNCASVEPGNVGMIESGENSLLPKKMPDEFFRPEALLDQLDRHLAAEMRVLGQIDFTHPTLAEQRYDSVVTEHFVGA